MRYIALISLALIGTAQAQTAPAEYTFKVNSQDVQMIGKALGALPYNEVAALMAKLSTQVQEQNKLNSPEPPK